MSVAQIAQRIIHSVEGTDTGQKHDFDLVKAILHEELTDILQRRGDSLGHLGEATTERYKKAVKIAFHWIKNYTQFDFRSLGSYTREDLNRIANQTEEWGGSSLEHTNEQLVPS